MDPQKGPIKWPIREDDFLIREEIPRVACHVLGIDISEVDENHISFLLDTYPQCFTLFSYYGMATAILKHPQLVPDGLIDDVVMELINLLEQRGKAPPLSPRLIRLLFHLRMLPEEWSISIFNQMEDELDIARKLFPVLHFISNEDSQLLNNLFRLYRAIHTEDAHLLSKMSNDQLNILSLIVVDQCHLTHTESIRPQWALNYFHDTRTSLQRRIKKVIIKLLGIEPHFPTDYDVSDIISHYGFVRPYHSRDELLGFYREFLTGNLSTAFIILQDCKLKAKNDHLCFLGDPVADTKDLLIGIGTMNDFSVTTLDELNDVWNHGLDTHCEYFQSPFSTTPLPHNIVNTLFHIITFTEHEEVQETYQRVIEYIKACQGSEGQLRRDYLVLPPNEQSKVRKVVKQIFLAGMYMRRWDGNGPYPVDEESTETNTVIYDDLFGYLTSDEIAEDYDEDCELVLVKVSKELEHLKNLFESLSPGGKSIIERLHEYDICHKRHTNRSFWSGIGKKTMESNYCIRMASSVWIGTSASFYQLIGKDAKFLHNFDLSQVEAIQ